VALWLDARACVCVCVYVFFLYDTLSFTMLVVYSSRSCPIPSHARSLGYLLHAVFTQVIYRCYKERGGESGARCKQHMLLTPARAGKRGGRKGTRERGMEGSKAKSVVAVAQTGVFVGDVGPFFEPKKFPTVGERT